MSETNELNVTPGEWFASGTSVMSTRLTQIAETSSTKINVNESEANSHLMAASKELYAALKRARRYVREALSVRESFNLERAPEYDDINAIDAALAKARGEGEA